MRRRFSLLVLLVACGTSSSSDSPGDGSSSSSSGSSSSSSGGTSSGGADASITIAQAKGDPCRGVALPDAQHYVPAGMCARLVASGVSGLRQIAFAPNGDLFGQSANGTIWRFHDADGDGSFAMNEIAKYGVTQGNGNNAHIDAAGGFIYAGTPAGARRFTYDASATSGGDGEDVVVDAPSGGAHPKHTVHVWDHWLYLQSGSAANAASSKGDEYDDARALIKRFDLSKFVPGSPFDFAADGEIVTKGLRNPNGFARTAAGRIFAVVNGLDDLHYAGQEVHTDNPGEQVVEIAAGKSYGYPFCFTAQRIIVNDAVIQPGTQLLNADFPGGHDDAWCAANSSAPSTFVQAHSAPLDLVFFEVDPKGALPEKWRGGAFVALHGSWDRKPPTGYKVVWIPFDAQGNTPMPTSTLTTTTFPYEVVFGGGSTTSGPVDGTWKWSSDPYFEGPRPAGVAISPIDGALYISSDAGGMLYRVGLVQ